MGERLRHKWLRVPHPRLVATDEALELVHPVQRGVCRLSIDQRDLRFFEALDEHVDGGGRHDGGLTN